MLETFIHIIKDFFGAIYRIHFGDYKLLSTECLFRNFTIDILKTINKLLYALIIALIFEQIYIVGGYIISEDVGKYKHIYDGLTFDLKAWFIIIVSFFAWHFSKVGIKRIQISLNIEKFFIEQQKQQIDQIYIQTLSLSNRISKNHEISYKFFSSWANEQNDYVKFIKRLQDSTKIKPEELKNIAEIAKKSTYGHFMCVIAYLDFFSDEKEFKEMINYFAKYEVVASKNNNIVQRIFTIPGTPKKEPNDRYYKSQWNSKEHGIYNHYLYCYLVLNEICSCDAYLLIYDNTEKHLLANCFLVDVDYVLAFKNQGDYAGDEVELYFAYPEADGERANDLNRTIKIKDAYFIRMFELDFQNRMKLDPDDETPTTFLKFSKANQDNILNMLHIDVKEDKININERLDMVKDLLQSNKMLNKSIIKKIDEWKIR